MTHPFLCEEPAGSTFLPVISSQPLHMFVWCLDAIPTLPAPLGLLSKVWLTRLSWVRASPSPRLDQFPVLLSPVPWSGAGWPVYFPVSVPRWGGDVWFQSSSLSSQYPAEVPDDQQHQLMGTCQPSVPAGWWWMLMGWWREGSESSVTLLPWEPDFRWVCFVTHIIELTFLNL